MSDPEQKTRFHREIARKLCEFPEEVERENYLQAVAEKYHIGADSLRRLVVGTAASTGLTYPLRESPKSGKTRKKTPEENARRSQGLLLAWLAEEPQLYQRVKQYVSAADFTDPLYRQVAGKLFASLEEGEVNAASIISLFPEEEEQRQVAGIFHTRLKELDGGKEREKAFHDILVAVKKQRYEADKADPGNDNDSFHRLIREKQALEELRRTRIPLT